MNKQTDTRTMLLTATSLQLMVILSLPAIIGMVVIGLYNLMDANVCNLNIQIILAVVLSPSLLRDLAVFNITI